MDAKLLDVLIEGLFNYRRGLLKQVGALDKAIEQLQTLKETKGKKVTVGDISEVAEHIKMGGESGIIDDMGPDPKKCKHEYTADACVKCGIFREVVEKEKADKPDK